jgi:hypothetical protein
MTGAGFSWVDLAASRERRRWLVLASIGCTLIAGILVVALLHEASVARTGGLALAVAGAVLALRRARSPECPCEVRLDPTGVLWRRHRALDADQALRAVGLSRWVASFEGPDGTLCLWRDSLPADRWRMLRAHIRWHVDRRPATARDGSGGLPGRAER